MIGRRFPSGRNRRQAFTLIEVLLTLFLLVILATLSWPMLQRPLANQRLRKAADLVRAKWVAARVEAMRTGQTYVFQYTAGSERCSVKCRPEALAGTDQVFGDASDDSAGVDSASTSFSKRYTLPETITFVAGQTAPDTRAAMAGPAADLPGASEAGLSVPILFYPDGTSSTAELVLKNEHGRHIKLVLRGLTGVVNVSDVYSLQEPLP